MRLSKQTSDAVKILTACARTDASRKAAEIADEIGITKQVGLKLVNMLARLGYVATVRGPRGGLRLAKPATAISVGQVVRDLEARRASPATDDEDAVGALSPFLDDAFDAFVSVLDAHSIADLAARPSASLVAGADTQQSGASKKRGRRSVPAASTRAGSIRSTPRNITAS